MLLGFVIHIINEGIVVSTLLFILGFALGFIALSFFVVGATQTAQKVNKNEMFETFKDYLSAKKQRVCPFIEVEK